jgi:hypothetical protein
MWVLKKDGNQMEPRPCDQPKAKTATRSDIQRLLYFVTKLLKKTSSYIHLNNLAAFLTLYTLRFFRSFRTIIFLP